MTPESKDFRAFDQATDRVLSATADLARACRTDCTEAHISAELARLTAAVNEMVATGRGLVDRPVSVIADDEIPF